MGTGDPWLLVQHVAFEGPGAIASALTDAGADLTVLRVDRGDSLPPPAAVRDMAGLVVMGGASSAASDEGFPTRREELALLADAAAWRTWLRAHHDDEAGVELVLAKKGTTEPTELTDARLFSASLSCRARCLWTPASSQA